MIRIRTRIGEKRVLTLLSFGKWVTLATGMDALDATSLLDAGQNHLNMAQALRDKER